MDKYYVTKIMVYFNSTGFILFGSQYKNVLSINTVVKKLESGRTEYM